jgi:hypothetical protein
MESKTDLARAFHLPRKQVRNIIDRYRVTDGKDARLKDFDPADTTGHLLWNSAGSAEARDARAG